MNLQEFYNKHGHLNRQADYALEGAVKPRPLKIEEFKEVEDKLIELIAGRDIVGLRQLIKDKPVIMASSWFHSHMEELCELIIMTKSVDMIDAMLSYRTQEMLLRHAIEHYTEETASLLNHITSKYEGKPPSRVLFRSAGFRGDIELLNRLKREYPSESMNLFICYGSATGNHIDIFKEHFSLDMGLSTMIYHSMGDHLIMKYLLSQATISSEFIRPLVQHTKMLLDKGMNDEACEMRDLISDFGTYLLSEEMCIYRRHDEKHALIEFFKI